MQQNGLLCLFDRLPLPCIPTLANVAQTWEGEVKDKHQSFPSRSHAQKPAPSGNNLGGRKIGACTPFWVLQMYGVEYHIRDAQQ